MFSSFFSKVILDFIKTLFGNIITLANGTDSDEISLRDVGSGGTFLRKLLAPSAKRAQNGGEQNIFFELPCQQNNASFHPLPGGRFP